MRLIDADAFIENMKTRLWNWETVDGIQTSTALRQVMADIGNAPTVNHVEQPRILTLDEVRTLAMYWYDERGKHKFNYFLFPIPVLHVKQDTFGDGDERAVLVWRSGGEMYPPVNKYGKTWICWNVKPTDEQRNEVQWEDD